MTITNRKPYPLLEPEVLSLLALAFFFTVSSQGIPNLIIKKALVTNNLDDDEVL